MYKHCIIMSSSYSDGTRIAIDFSGENVSPIASAQECVKEILKQCGKDVSISTHFLQAEEPGWEAVGNYDPFFLDVELISTTEEFIKKINKDRTLTGLDIAKYIVSQIKCTHLSLEKLVYLSYADYLCDYEDKLFNDKIFAFKYGPVVSSVYEYFKNSGYGEITLEDDKQCISNIEKLPIKTRILFANDGLKKIQSIDKTIKKYKEYSAKELVEITHRDGSPWSNYDSSKPYQEMSDDIIKEFHYVEA